MDFVAFIIAVLGMIIGITAIVRNNSRAKRGLSRETKMVTVGFTLSLISFILTVISIFSH